MKCPVCKIENPVGAKFCGNCGYKLPRLICPKCDIEVKAQFCYQCGTHVVASDFCSDSQGRTYKTVFIGDQEWMAKNLAVTIDIYGNRLILGRDYFFPDGNASNVPRFGLLYTWDAAMRIAPAGWHLPTVDDWNKLFAYCSRHYALGGNPENIAKALASTEIWHDTMKGEFDVAHHPQENNASGFSAIPVGWHDEEPRMLPLFACLWSSTEVDNSYAQYLEIIDNCPSVCLDKFEKKYAMSVRCVRD